MLAGLEYRIRTTFSFHAVNNMAMCVTSAGIITLSQRLTSWLALRSLLIKFEVNTSRGGNARFSDVREHCILMIVDKLSPEAIESL